MKLIFLLMAMALPAAATPGDPGETALHFLEKVRTKNLNLEPGTDTAISPHTSESKRKEIARRLERMAGDLGSDPLEVGSVKLDGDFAAVLIRKIGGFDPGSLQVFPVALVKHGTEWTAAPVPASFENAGVGYAETLRKSLDTLEDWMLREQVIDLEQLRERSAERMRRKIEETLPTATLRSFTPQQAVERFLKACAAKKLPETLGLLGGLAASLPEDWPLRLKSANNAMAAHSETPYPWRLLISDEVPRAIVHSEDERETALFSIACLDPAGGSTAPSRPRIEIVHLNLAKSSDGLWRVNLPPEFLQNRPNPEAAAEDDLDADLLDAFPSKLADSHPPAPRSTVEALRNDLLAAFHDGGLSSLIPLMRLRGDPKTARESCVRAAQVWWTLREPASIRRAIPLDLREDGNRAAASFQFFSARNPDQLDLRVLYFTKSPDGWSWTPNPTEDLEQSFADWTGLQAKHWQVHWQDSVLADCALLTQIPDAGAPSDEDSRKLVESWFRATRDGDIPAALRLTARLNLPDSAPTLLQNLGYELLGIRKSSHPPAITATRSGEIWTTVAVRTDPGDKPSFPLYPVISTPVGPRLLTEIDLSASAGRSRDFLNETALERLRKSSPSAAAELKKLVAEHRQDVLAPPKE